MHLELLEPLHSTMSQMEVDPPVDHPTEVDTTLSLESTVEELEKAIGELHSKPLNVKLLRRQLMLVRQLGMQDEEQQAVVSLSENVALSEGACERLACS